VKGLETARFFSKKELNYIDPFIAYAVLAAMESVENAGLLSEDKKITGPCGIILGSSRGGITTIEKEFMKMSSGGPKLSKPPRVSPFLMPTSTISAAAVYTGTKLGITGYILGISNACASGANAIGEAFRMIRNGTVSLMLAGGTEAPICRLCIEGYGVAGALSESAPDDASRPFDIRRDGFVLAEGACVLTLEDMESAIKRNAPVLGEIIGYGNVCDASHLTLPSVKGEILAIRESMHDAGISPDDVDYINTHGTSTLAGDKTEAAAIKKIFGDRRVPSSSVKSMTGHMLAASGAFEAACTTMSLKEGIITPTINTRDIDPGCDINLITNTTKTPLNIAITNSFGFGGVNAVLVLRRFCT
jgi:3-oxoacyl-[acyl-carrier-protein] synthase II